MAGLYNYLCFYTFGCRKYKSYKFFQLHICAIIMKRNYQRFILSFLLAFVLCVGVACLNPATAQNQTVSEKNPLQWRLIGRVFFDGGVFMNDTLGWGNAFQVNDVRLGTVVKIFDNWEAKIELGYADKKISMKDIYVNYKLNSHSFRLGYAYEPWGNARVGTAAFRFMQNATADNALGQGRQLGISYSYNYKWMNVMAGVFSGGDIQTSGQMDQGYSVAAKFIGRPLMKEGRVLHLAIAPRFADDKEVVDFTGGVPTNLVAKKDNGFVDASVDRVINSWKLDAECIFIYDKWYFQGQFLVSHLNRHGVDNFNGKGGYAQAGYLILGEKHNYNESTGMIGNPAPKSLELLLRYDNVNLNDAGIRGGRLSDITVGMNYFINKYIAAKLNYTRMMVGDSSPKGGGDFDLLQARLQVSF